jgi:hypothetical protein
MSQVQQIRRENLRTVLRQHGGAAKIARKMGLASTSYISQLLSGHRPFGEKAARNIEKRLELEEFSLDKKPGEAVPFSGTDRVMLTDAVRAIDEETSALKVKLAPEKFARLVAHVYEMGVHSGAIERSEVRKILELML